LRRAPDKAVEKSPTGGPTNSTLTPTSVAPGGESPEAKVRLAPRATWCQNGTVKRMNLRDVPDDVYAVLVAAAEGSRQSLNAFVVDRLCEVALAARVADYVATYPTPRGTGVTAEDVVAAVREVREAS
jgi:hypothetical protein